MNHHSFSNTKFEITEGKGQLYFFQSNIKSQINHYDIFYNNVVLFTKSISMPKHLKNALSINKINLLVA